MSATAASSLAAVAAEYIDPHVLKKYDVRQIVGRGVSMHQ